MKTSQLARAIATAMTGSVLSATGISAATAGTVNYNTFNQGVAQPWDLVSGGHGTDGWMRTTANSASTPTTHPPRAGCDGEWSRSVPCCPSMV